MKFTSCFLGLFALMTTAQAQITDSATAVMHFDSSLTETFSGILPTFHSPSSFVFVDDRFGNPKSAVQLSTQLDYGNPAFSNMGAGDFSIAFWFRKDGSLWQEKPIVQKRLLDVSDPNNVVFEEYRLYYNDWIGNSFQVNFKPANDSAGVRSTLGLLPENEWLHIAVIFDRSDSLKAYLDGQLYNTAYIGHLQQYQANIDSAVLEVGHGNMSMDELLFFDQALSHDEVLELYNAVPSTGISEKPISQSLHIYPNPNNGSFTVQMPASVKPIGTAKLLDITGREVAITALSQSGNELQLQLENAVPGMYLLYLETTDGPLVEKLEVR